MDIIITTKSQQNPGPDISINCPLCNATGVAAQSFEQLDEIGLFWLIPLCRLRNTFVRCSECTKQLIAKASIHEIGDYSVEEISQRLVGRVPLISQFLAVASVLLFFVPFVGLVMALIAVIVNRRNTGWLRTLSWIGAILSGLITMLFVVALAMNRG